MSEKTFPFFELHGHLTGVFGCEEDKWSPLVYADGSIRILPYGENEPYILIDYGYTPTSQISWVLAEGYLPCHNIEYDSGTLHVKIEHVADTVSWCGARFEAAYSRVTVKNRGTGNAKLLSVPAGLTLLSGDEAASVLAPGKKSVREYAVFCDRLGDEEQIYPEPEVLKRSGCFDTHYRRMKKYWKKRLEGIVSLELPDGELVNAYKAGYIYTLIVKDHSDLWVGVNNYHTTFSHDSVGIMQGLFTLGDMKYAKDYIEAFADSEVEYPDGFWKIPWVYAVYMLKTGDEAYIRENFGVIKEWTHKIGDGLDADEGIMAKTFAIDSLGYWTIDDESAMMGLIAYIRICERLGEDEEKLWANGLYKTILDNTNRLIEKTQAERGIKYIPICPMTSNDLTPRSDPRDANWASMFLFGRWNWDGYLFGAPQYGVLKDCVDATYEWGIENRREVSDSPYCFGGYPHGYSCSAYNAGYGSAALSGERYRDMGIRAYRYMLDRAQTAPYSFWEGITINDEAERIWDKSPVVAGGGSCPHMWGQSTGTKVLVDSVVALKYDGSLVVGRGLPAEWTEDGQKVAAKNFLAANGQRVDVSVEAHDGVIDVEVSGDIPYTAQLPAFVGRIKSAQGCEFDRGAGIVYVPSGGKVTVELDK